MVEIMAHNYLMLDCFAGQSMGRYYPWTLNASAGIMSFF